MLNRTRHFNDLGDVRLRLRLVQEGPAIVDLAGHVDPPFGSPLHKLLVAALETSSLGLDVNLRHIGVFGSGGVRALVGLAEAAAAAHKTIRLTDVPQHVAFVLDACALDIERSDLASSPDERLSPHPVLENVVTKSVLRGREAICITSTADLTDAKIVFVNEAFTELTGHEPVDVLGRTMAVVQGDLTVPSKIAAMGHDETEDSETIGYRSDGTPFVLRSRALAIEEGSAVRYWISTLHDGTVARRLGRFEAALTYIDAHRRLARDEATETDAQLRRLDSILAAHVALIEGGDAAVSLELESRATVVRTTAETPERRAELISALDGLGPIHTSTELRTGSHAALVLPIRDEPNHSVDGVLLLAGLHPDRLRLADPILHEQLLAYGLSWGCGLRPGIPGELKGGRW